MYSKSCWNFNSFYFKKKTPNETQFVPNILIWFLETLSFSRQQNFGTQINVMSLAKTTFSNNLNEFSPMHFCPLPLSIYPQVTLCVCMCHFKNFHKILIEFFFLCQHTSLISKTCLLWVYDKGTCINWFKKNKIKGKLRKSRGASVIFHTSSQVRKKNF